MTDRYTDADPEETVTVTGVGHMTLPTTHNKYKSLLAQKLKKKMLVYRDAGKQPSFFDMADLSRLAKMERFR